MFPTLFQRFQKSCAAGLAMALLTAFIIAASAQAESTPVLEPTPATVDSRPLPKPLIRHLPERYQRLVEHSPFALASEVPALPEPAPEKQPDFAKDLYLTGVVRLNDGEYITIASRDNTRRFSLATGQTYDGLQIASVAWADAIAATKVTLKCGNQFATIAFDQAAALPSSGAIPGQLFNTNARPLSTTFSRTNPPSDSPGGPPRPVPQSEGDLPPGSGTAPQQPPARPRFIRSNPIQ